LGFLVAVAATRPHPAGVLNLLEGVMTVALLVVLASAIAPAAYVLGPARPEGADVTLQIQLAVAFGAILYMAYIMGIAVKELACPKRAAAKDGKRVKKFATVLQRVGEMGVKADAETVAEEIECLDDETMRQALGAMLTLETYTLPESLRDQAKAQRICNFMFKMPEEEENSICNSWSTDVTMSRQLSRKSSRSRLIARKTTAQITQDTAAPDEDPDDQAEEDVASPSSAPQPEAIGASQETCEEKEDFPENGQKSGEPSQEKVVENGEKKCAAEEDEQQVAQDERAGEDQSSIVVDLAPSKTKTVTL